MASEPQNSPFIKNLASSDKKIRDNALSSLRAFLSAQSSIPPLELLKLWKGLFYCLWMQDKPALQQRLARDFASLISDLKEPVVLPFIDAFWKTMAREWSGIEALRMDKYLYLVRQYVNAGFRWLAKGDWANEEAVERYAGILEETPLNATDAKIPHGLRYHVLDVFVDELEKVGGEKVETLPLETLLRPVEKLAKEGMQKSLRKAAKECLDDERVKRWRGEDVDADKEMQDEEDDDEDEWGGIED